MDITKRRLLAAGGLGVLIGGGTGAMGAEIDPAHPGFVIRIGKHHGIGWVVLVPDLDQTTYSGQRPESNIVATKWMPLKEWLAIMDADVQS